MHCVTGTSFFFKCGVCEYIWHFTIVAATFKVAVVVWMLKSIERKQSFKLHRNPLGSVLHIGYLSYIEQQYGNFISSSRIVYMLFNKKGLVGLCILSCLYFLSVCNLRLVSCLFTCFRSLTKVALFKMKTFTLCKKLLNVVLFCKDNCI